jgi:hypothetical protein
MTCGLSVEFNALLYINISAMFPRNLLVALCPIHKGLLIALAPITPVVSIPSTPIIDDAPAICKLKIAKSTEGPE